MKSSYFRSIGIILLIVFGVVAAYLLVVGLIMFSQYPLAFFFLIPAILLFSFIGPSTGLLFLSHADLMDKVSGQGKITARAYEGKLEENEAFTNAPLAADYSAPIIEEKMNENAELIEETPLAADYSDNVAKTEKEAKEETTSYKPPYSIKGNKIVVHGRSYELSSIKDVEVSNKKVSFVSNYRLVDFKCNDADEASEVYNQLIAKSKN